jgi:hypothetical protein
LPLFSFAHGTFQARLYVSLSLVQIMVPQTEAEGIEMNRPDHRGRHFLCNLTQMVWWRSLAVFMGVVLLFQGVQLYGQPLPVTFETPVVSRDEAPPLASVLPTKLNTLSDLSDSVPAEPEMLYQSPPEIIPLPSPITLARSQSAFSMDTIPDGQLTITYTVLTVGTRKSGKSSLSRSLKLE